MSVDTIIIKRHNHRVHPCDRNQKLALLKHLIALHSDKEILIIAAQDISDLDEQLDADNVTLKSDAELLENPKVKCDMVISLDLAKDPETYVKRLNQTKTYALLLADDKDQQELYKIETLMKRTLTKEVLPEFEPASYVKDREAAKDLKERQEYNIKNQEERDEKRKKAKKESKYLGKDEDGKPIFSGKTQERNHRYDGTPRTDDEKRENPRYKAKKSSDNKPWDKKDGDKKPFEKKPWDNKGGDKKPWDKKDGDKKPWDKDNRGDKKPWDKKDGDKKPFEKKSWDKKDG
ncbi:MAG: DEAD/DEAH box helicase, partial [Sulfurimonadaceae bacterium]